MTRGLLTRLAGGEPPARGDRERYASILEHLRVLLNTRQGDSEAAPDFGIPDFTDFLHNLPGGVMQLQVALQETIARFEPRLTQVVVRPVDLDTESLVLHFEVSARLVDSGTRQALRFSTRVLRGGRVAVG